MAGTRHVYETYIKASPEQIWGALTDPKFTERWYFGTMIQSGWEPGDDYQYVMPDGSAAITGTVVEIDPPRRLVMSFKMDHDPEAAAEEASQVTWEITPVGEASRLTLFHGDLALSPKTWQNTVTGWPILLAAVKTLLETGEPLGQIADDKGSPHAVEGPVDVAWHRAQAITANNGVYQLLDDVGSSTDHGDLLTHQAHAAAYHWSIAGTIEPRARAEYLLSRVYAYLGRAEPALHHARRAIALVDEAGLADFDLAFAREALARALACDGQTEAALAERREAAAVTIKDPDDRQIFEADLNAGPWYSIQDLNIAGAA